MAWFSFWDLLLILIIVIVFFGAKKLPELGRGLGQTTKEFKRGLKRGGEEPS